MCFKKFNSGVNKSIFPELRLSFFDKRFIFFDTPRIYGKMTGLSGGGPKKAKRPFSQKTSLQVFYRYYS